MKNPRVVVAEFKHETNCFCPNKTGRKEYEERYLKDSNEVIPFFKDTRTEIGELNQALLEWEKVYNTIRPHQALGYLTPLEFLEQYQQKRREVMCH